MAWPDSPWDVAVIVANPGIFPVTIPVLVTVATEVSELDQAIVSSLISPPPAFLRVAIMVWVLLATITTMAGIIFTDATGVEVIVMRAVPTNPSTLQVIVVKPGAIAVTNPEFDAVAADGLELSHITTESASSFPVESIVVLVSC